MAVFSVALLWLPVLALHLTPALFAGLITSLRPSGLTPMAKYRAFPHGVVVAHHDVNAVHVDVQVQRIQGPRLPSFDLIHYSIGHG